MSRGIHKLITAEIDCSCARNKRIVEHVAQTLMFQLTSQLHLKAQHARAWLEAHIGECPSSLELQLLLVIVAKELHQPFHDPRLPDNLFYGWLLLYGKKLPEVASGFQLEVSVLGHELLNLHSQGHVKFDSGAWCLSSRASWRCSAGKHKLKHQSDPLSTQHEGQSLPTAKYMQRCLERQALDELTLEERATE